MPILRLKILKILTFLPMLWSLFFGWWLKKCYQTADLILTPSDYSKSLIEEYGINRPIQVISNGIDLDYWQATNEEINEFKKNYGLKKEDKLILSVGLQIERKGIIEFVEMARKLPEYQFIWFGYTDPKLLPKKVVRAIQTDLPNLQFPVILNEMIYGLLIKQLIYMFF